MGLSISRTIIEAHGGRLWAAQIMVLARRFDFPFRRARAPDMAEPAQSFTSSTTTRASARPCPACSGPQGLRARTYLTRHVSFLPTRL